MDHVADLIETLFSLEFLGSHLVAAKQKFRFIRKAKHMNARLGYTRRNATHSERVHEIIVSCAGQLIRLEIIYSDCKVQMQSIDDSLSN